MNNEGTRSVLENILPDYESIVKAPNMATLEARAKEKCVEVEALIEAERRKKYKAYDTYTGGVYLISNPAAWAYDGQNYVRPKPEFQFNLSDAQRGGAGTGKRRGVASDSF